VDKAVDSAPKIIQDLTDAGYDVDTEIAAEIDPARWPYYDLVIWSCSGNCNPVADVAYRYNLNSYAGAGGRLLVEGGDVGHDAVSDPGYPNFADSTLHVESWTGDFSGDLVIAMPDHPIATTPNLLPDTLDMQAFGLGDQDALVPDADTEVIYEWTSYPGEGGVLMYDDNPDSAACQIVFFSFDYANVTDTDGRKALLENAVVHLVAAEPAAEGAISGNVQLYGWPSHEGAVVSTHPMRFAQVGSGLVIRPSPFRS
jgi:hypothetical protein